MKDKFYKNSLTMTFSNAITGITGFVFTIILSRRLGTEGLGLYSLIMPVYVLMLCLTSEGLITALSKISAIYFSKKDFNNLSRTFATVFIFITLWSSSIALLFLVNSSNIGLHLIHDKRVIDALKVICPALLFAPISAILKGYFYGMGKFNIPAVIDIVEKAFRVIVLLSLTFLLSLHDVKNTVTSAYVALALGEVISCILLFAAYSFYRKKTKLSTQKSKSRIQLLFDVLVISSPICLNGVISSVIPAISTIILPRRLMSAGFTYHHALSSIGEFTGMALSIAFLPIIVVNSMMIVLIPDLSLSISRKNFWAAEQRIAQVMKISCLVGIIMLIITLSIPDSLGLLFYDRPDLGNMIIFASISSFLSYVSAPTYTILNSLGKQNKNLKISFLVSMQGLVLVYLLAGIPSLNIYGLGISFIITSLTALFMNMYEIKKICDVRISVRELVLLALAGVISYFLLKPMSIIFSGLPLIIKVVLIVVLASLMVYSLFKIFRKFSSSIFRNAEPFI
jgi:stage V sporulation protein B